MADKMPGLRQSERKLLMHFAQSFVWVKLSPPEASAAGGNIRCHV
jgi:hypothetical protein